MYDEHKPVQWTRVQTLSFIGCNVSLVVDKTMITELKLLICRMINL
jgi:hypothetical protein